LVVVFCVLAVQRDGNSGARAPPRLFPIACTSHRATGIDDDHDDDHDHDHDHDHEGGGDDDDGEKSLWRWWPTMRTKAASCTSAARAPQKPGDVADGSVKHRRECSRCCHRHCQQQQHNQQQQQGFIALLINVNDERNDNGGDGIRTHIGCGDCRQGKPSPAWREKAARK
jgi:hypothetical protein